jgi:formylglycine-generating enzyme required for sulfatase activity
MHQLLTLGNANRVMTRPDGELRDIESGRRTGLAPGSGSVWERSKARSPSDQATRKTSSMEPTVRDTLRRLILRYGHSLCEDPARCQAMLNDVLRGGHKREVNLLVSVLKEGIAVDLLRGRGELPVPLLLGRLQQRLEDDLMLRTDAAHWAAETWALALGIIGAPVVVQPSPSPPLLPAEPPQPNTGIAGPRRLSLARLPFEPEMVVIPAGRFLMGAPAHEPERMPREGPQHWVQVPTFELGRYAVTFDEWDACVAAGGCAHKPSHHGWGRGRRPVIEVSWHDAQAYVRWLSRTTGQAYRLPSEAEWEYACRAGTTTPFSTGCSIHTEQANYDDNQDYGGCGARTGIDLRKTQPVGSYPPNPWGLYEMSGNVWEWTADCWHGRYTNAPTDGSAWQTSDCWGHVVRGGSWSNGPGSLRVARRVGFVSCHRTAHLGFRVARTL